MHSAAYRPSGYNGVPRIPSIDALRRSHKAWVEEALARAEQVRETKWTESVAVGSRSFVQTIKGKEAPVFRNR